MEEAGGPTMMTPQEVSEHAFAKASFGGYNMAMVDEFLDLLTEDYTSLYKENAVLKSKMKVLVDKVEEYRSTEDAMRKALLTAQRMADEMVAEAEAQKAELLKTVEADARARHAQLQQELANEEARLAAARQSTADYLGKLKELYQHEMDYLNGLSRLTAAPSQADQVGETAHAIEHAVEEAVQEEKPVPQAPAAGGQGDGSLYAELLGLDREGAGELQSSLREPAASPASGGSGEDDTAPTRRIDFSNLQFGKDYEIK